MEEQGLSSELINKIQSAMNTYDFSFSIMQGFTFNFPSEWADKPIQEVLAQPAAFKGLKYAPSSSAILHQTKKNPHGFGQKQECEEDEKVVSLVADLEEVVGKGEVGWYEPDWGPLPMPRHTQVLIVSSSKTGLFLSWNWKWLCCACGRG